MPIKKASRTADPSGFNRRELLTTAAKGAGALWLAFYLPAGGVLGRGEVIAEAAALPGDIQLNAYLRIGADNRITILFGGCELGQGIMSGLCQVLAEELMVDWTQVNVEQADAALSPTTGAGISYPTFLAGTVPVNVLYLTGGSGAMRGGNRFTILRTAGATAREMLISAGATAMGVDRSLCSAVSGRVVVNGTTQSKTYGELAAAAALLPVPAVTLADPAQAKFRLIGSTLARLDVPQKTDGSAVFGIDVRLPGMLYAVVKHSPTIGGTLAKTPGLPSGARYVFPLKAEVSRGAVVQGSLNAVAVVADNTWKAMKAARSLQANWTVPASLALVDSASILSQAQSLMATGPALLGEQIGSPDDLLAGATTSIDSTYFLPYVPHVTMEVLNCTVKYTGTTCEIWAPTQTASGVAATAKALTGLTGSNVVVHTTFLGGGLGRKIEQDYISQAVQTAIALYQKTGSGVVKLMWPREEDFANDQFRPMALVRVRAGINNGAFAMTYRTVTPSIRIQRGGTLTAADSNAVEGAVASLYGFAGRRVEHVVHPAAIPVGYWRSVGNSINTFALESAIDELATALGKDPLTFRQELLTANAANPKAARALAVVNAAAALASWRTSLPAGHAWGMAFVECFGTLVCQIAEISQPVAGSIRVHRVACAVDCGLAVNPGSVEAQIQGAIVHGLSAALWGQMTFVNGQPTVRNFNAYRMLVGREMPHVDVTIVNSGAPIGGIGEPGVPAIAPAVANAYFRLTGIRVRNLPFFPNAGGLGDG